MKTLTFFFNGGVRSSTHNNHIPCYQEEESPQLLHKNRKQTRRNRNTCSFVGPIKRPFHSVSFPEPQVTSCGQCSSLSLYQPLVPLDFPTMPHSVISSDFPVGSSYFCHQVSDEIFSHEIFSPIPTNRVWC